MREPKNPPRHTFSPQLRHFKRAPQDRSSKTKDSFARIIAVVGLITALLGLYKFYQEQQERRTDRDIKTTHLLDEAWDIMTGRSGSTIISVDTVTSEEDKGAMEMARRRIDEASRLGSAHERAMSSKAVYFLKIGEFQEAVACFEQIVRHNPRDPWAHNNLGAAWHAWGAYNTSGLRITLSKAAKSYQKAISLDPTH